MRRAFPLPMLGLAIAVLAGLAAAAPSAAGVVPGQVQFQGLLLDDLGDPVNANVAIGFELFDAAAARCGPSRTLRSRCSTASTRWRSDRSCH